MRALRSESTGRRGTGWNMKAGDLAGAALTEDFEVAQYQGPRIPLLAGPMQWDAALPAW